MTEHDSASASDDAFEDRQWERRKALIHKLRLSALYHQKVARYYELSDKVMQAIAVLGSATAVTQLFAANADNKAVQLWASALVAVVSTLLLVYTPNAKANVHANIVRDFRKLLASVHAAGEYPKAEDIDGWISECITLEVQEPSALCALVSECEYQLAIATPENARSISRPGWWKRKVMYVVDFAPPSVKDVGSAAKG